ncbi:MAG: YihY/virulence factor BrkB family protein [Bacteroidota bacterium]
MLKKKQEKIFLFFKDGIWEIEVGNLPMYKKLPIKIIKVIIIAIKSYGKDKTPIHASALTYFSLLSIVPVIAVGFAIAKGFGLENMLEEEIAKSLAGQKEVSAYLLNFAKTMLSTTKGGILAVVSISVLLYTVLKLFHQIENTFNIIWKVERSRSFIRKFTDYLSITLIAPILIVLSGTVNVYITTILKDFSQNTDFFELISPIIMFSIKLIPYFLIWVLFTLLYLIMPNKGVKFTHAFIAGLIAGTAYQLIQFYYINFQIGFSRYNAIYGSFAALPLFLIWLQISWNVVLLGAQIAAAFENIKSFGYKEAYPLLSQANKRILSLLVLKKIVIKFKTDEPAPSASNLSEESQLPLLYVSNIVDELSETGLISRVSNNKMPDTFQPAKDISLMNFAEVIEKLNAHGEAKLLSVTKNKDFESINKVISNFTKTVKDNYSNTLIKDL